MSNLDKSLDEIIAANPHSRIRRGRRVGSGVAKVRARARKVSNPVTVAKKLKAVSAAKIEAIQPKLNPLDEATRLADKIIISNLPTDVTESAVKEYFSHEIGPIVRCEASYNKQGRFTGIINVTFKKPGDADRAVKKFNGTSIDNGARTMKVELVMDPAKRPLSTRLKPVKPVEARPIAKASKPKKVAPKKTAVTATKSGRKVRRPKKTVEELDAEMADYFQEGKSGASA